MGLSNPPSIATMSYSAAHWSRHWYRVKLSDLGKAAIQDFADTLC